MESLMVSGAMVAKELRHEKRKAICFEPKIEDMQDIYGIAKKRAYPVSTLSHVNKVVTVTVPEMGNRRVVVNTCSPTYKLTRLETVLDNVESALEDFDYSVRYSHSEYCRFFIDYILKEKMQVGDDIIFPRLRVEHSYSGELKFGAKFGFFRQVCTNGLSVAHGQQMEFKTKNTKNSSIQFELGKTLHSFLKKAETMKDAYSPLLGEYVEFEDLTIEKIIDYSKAPKSLLAASIETFNREATMGMERNMWLAYNSINFQLNHNYTSLNMQEWNRNKLDSQLLQTCLGLCKGTSN